jgi:hypothetical protein
LFGRKKASKPEEGHSTPVGEPDGSATSAAPAAGAAAEDKYDQKAQFKEALASQSAESLRAAFWSMVKHDHPDALLLRFLRARKWDVQNALIMLISTMHWRSEEMHVDDDIMLHGEGSAIERSHSSDPATKREADDFMAQVRMGKSFIHGLDKDGRPICFCRVRLHQKGQQSETSLERYTVYLIETARLLMPPPVDTAVSIQVLYLHRAPKIQTEISSIVPHLRHDWFLNGEYGLRSCEIHDQMLRSQLP